MKRIALAIARQRDDLAGPCGIGRFSARGLAILHGPAPIDVEAPRIETIQAYASTVEALHVRETILPLRFGSVHQTEADLDDWLRVHADDWRSRLDEVEDTHEMGLRIRLDPPIARERIPWTTPKDRPGTAYLEALKARQRDVDATKAQANLMTARLDEALGGTFRRSKVDPPALGRESLLSLVYLVPRTSLAPFLGALGPLLAREPGKYLVTGPWPPYSFVDDPIGSLEQEE